LGAGAGRGTADVNLIGGTGTAGNRYRHA
jgi:hypothetical protein